MKRKYVLALTLAATLFATMPVQAFAADYPLDTQTEETIANQNEDCFEFEFDNFTATCKLAPGMPEVQLQALDVLYKDGSIVDHTTISIPNTISYNGAEYYVSVVGELSPELQRGTKRLIYPQNPRIISLEHSFLNLDELILPRNLALITEIDSGNDKLPTGARCMYLTNEDGTPWVKKISFNVLNSDSNEYIGVSKKHNCIYYKQDSPVDPDTVEPVKPLPPVDPEKPENPEIPLTPLEPSTPVEKPELKPEDNKKPSTKPEGSKKPELKPANQSTAPKTGDPASAGTLAMLLAGSSAAIATTLKKRK